MKPADPAIEAAHARVMELNAAIEKARSEAHERCTQRRDPKERQRCWELHRMEIEPLLKEREVVVEKLARVASFQAPPAILVTADGDDIGSCPECGTRVCKHATGIV